MMPNYATSIRRAALGASRLQRDLGIQAGVIRGSGRVDVFDVINRLDVPLMFTKLKGLLGVYMREPSPGVLVTTERPQSQQRFTAAHELGHHYLGHNPSLDDESILRRAPFQAAAGDDPQEVEAEAFAALFLMPQWLVDWHCERQGWTDADLQNPVNVYQLALRVGTTFKSAVWTLHRYDVFGRGRAKAMADLELKKVKEKILRGYKPENYQRDVWLVTDRDRDMRLEGGAGDLVVVRLPEHSGSGYLWRVESLDGEVVADGREEPDEESVGSHTMRWITAVSRERGTGELKLAETQPWSPGVPINTFELSYNLAGPAPQGWYEPQRRQHRSLLLEAAA